jgi:hypothetical protein
MRTSWWARQARTSTSAREATSCCWRDRRRELISGGPGFDRARIDQSDRRLGVERAIP